MMSTRSLVHPSLLAGLELMPAFNFSPEALPVIRKMMDEGIAAQPVPELPVKFHEETIAGPGGHKISLRIFTPDQRTDPAPAVYQIHGGGYVMGTAQMGDIGNRYLAVATGAVVVAVDYRLAPETAHPGPVEDCYAGLQWLHANAKALGVDANRIATKGESAGGGLAAALALLARDKGGPAICYQTLIYPMLDDRTGVSDDPHPYTGEFCWTSDANRFGWASLLGHEPGGDGVSAHAAAARAKNLDGLPPTFICCGALDLFVEEDIEFARRLMRAGVPTELHIYPGAYHGFDINAGSPLVETMGRDFTGALRNAFYG
jgi:acetyl esterase/lipase